MDPATVTAITSQVDFATVAVGLGVIFGAIAILSITMKGGSKLISAIK